VRLPYWAKMAQLSIILIIDYGFLLLYRIACVTITSGVLDQSRFLLIMDIMSLSPEEARSKIYRIDLIISVSESIQ
jgi:hypothetical protein